MVKFYEVKYEYGVTVPIKATRRPTIQEAAAFCALRDAGAVVSVNEISAEELLANYNCNGIDDWPVFNRPEVKAPSTAKADDIICRYMGHCADDDCEAHVDEEQKSDNLAVAILVPLEKLAKFVPAFMDFKPLSDTHKNAEEWVARFNDASYADNSNVRAVIIEFNTNALRVALQYAVIFSGYGTEGATVVL